MSNRGKVMSSGSAKAYNSGTQAPIQKKRSFLKRWFSRMSKEAWEESKDYSTSVPNGSLIAKEEVGFDSEKSIRFTIHFANGGRVVQTYRYDIDRDRTRSGLYVITEEQDFGKEIDKIITMESLRA
jgi:hypothetical protein